MGPVYLPPSPLLGKQVLQIKGKHTLHSPSTLLGYYATYILKASNTSNMLFLDFSVVLQNVVVMICALFLLNLLGQNQSFCRVSHVVQGYSMEADQPKGLQNHEKLGLVAFSLDPSYRRGPAYKLKFCVSVCPPSLQLFQSSGCL